MRQPDDLTTLATIGAVHGVKGWVRIFSYTDPAENIFNFRQFYLLPQSVPGSQAANKPLKQIEIDEAKVQGKHFIAHIHGCDDREEARLYTGCSLQVEKSLLPALGKEEYYWFQLQGLKVINLQDEVLGTVHHLMETGANDVLVVRACDDSIDEEERLIPYLREQVVKQIDLEKKIISVDWEKDY